MSAAAPRPGHESGDLQPLLPSDPSTIAGYRILGRLGAGGMGVVYLGRTAAGELAAVKVTHADQADQPDFRARFRREVEAARRVSSPWAVPVTGADPDAPEPWMATAFVAGPSLGEAVAAHGALPERSVRLLGWSVARALAAVHAAGLVHRDVKPGNVLLAVDGPRLIDFGIARTTGETALTATDMVVGTPGFLAPEQAEARTDAIGPPADVFALGCLLAYAATGRPPFGTGAVDALMYRTVHDEPDLTGVPEGLLDLVRDCLAKDPAARPTAAETGVRLVEDAPGDGAEWLPAPVVRTIAERSARMLALPEIDTTEPGTAPAPPTKSRRGFLLAAGAAVLAVGGGVWAGLGDGRESRGDGKKTPPPPRTSWTIGVLADLSGPAKVIGQAQERGARLAVEQFNARKDKPFTLELKVVDDRGDAARAVERARVLTTDPGVVAVLGATTDAVGLAVLSAFEEAGLPLITVSAGYNMLTLRPDGSRPNGTVLRAIPSHIFAGSHLAYAATLLPKISRPGVLEDRTEDSYSWQLTGGVRFGFGQAGITPHYRVVPARARARDYRRVLGEMIDAGIDAYVHCGITETAVLAARALTELGFTGPRFTGQHVFGQDFVERGGADVEGWFVGAPVADPATLKTAAAFTAAHRKRYGTAPAYYAGESYDVVTMTLQQLAADAKAGRKPARKGLWAALRKQKYTGAMGGYTFNETGELSPGGTFVFAVQNGAYKPVGAAPLVPNRPAQNKKKA
ncbi:bifunctional serine/threonine-protein kinase/ABC transporter substrate-binding protein [Streptomyces sp. NPDC049602]|uniref:bifunctional serine/threonine-protein kinase/ABC transporter substrate-binding protein n=1 Tax=Streptomyces sp. NPDC049602 TaxID=3155504 RepID=UPI00343FBD7A